MHRTRQIEGKLPRNIPYPCPKAPGYHNRSTGDSEPRIYFPDIRPPSVGKRNCFRADAQIDR